MHILNPFAGKGTAKKVKESLSGSDFVYMSDVSFNDVSKMKLLYTTFGESFIWIDHHAPVIMESFKLKFELNFIYEFE